MERAKEKLAHSRVGCRVHVQQRALPHELTDRAAREHNEAQAAAKKNTQLRRKQAKRQHERQEARRRAEQGHRYQYYDSAYRTHPEPPQRVVPDWELAERWEEAREKAGGLVPTDWHRDAYHISDDDYTRRCVLWLNHDDEQKRMSALHSLHAFLSPQPADRDDDNARRRIDAVLAPHSNHSAPIAAHLRRCLVAGGHHRSVEEQLVAVMVAGRMGLWCPQSMSSGLLVALTDLATAGPATGDDGGPRRAAAAFQIDHEDLRAAAIEVVGVIQFVELWQMAMMDSVEVEEEVMAMIESTLMPLCTAEDNSAPVRSAALSAVGLLGTLLSPPDIVAWIEEHVELLLGCLEERGVDIDVRQAAVDTLLVFLEIVDHARHHWAAETDNDEDDNCGVVESDDEDDDKEEDALALGQHDLYRLEEAVEQLIKKRERRADKDDSKRLRLTAGRLLRVLRHQHPGRPGDNGPVNDAQPEDEECAPAERLLLRNSYMNSKTEVYQPELVVYSAWHQKQLRSLQAVVGTSLPIYAQTGPTALAVADGPLSHIIREMAEQNELVVGYRARRKQRRIGPSLDPALTFKRAKGTNRNKLTKDYTHTGQPLPVPSLVHSTSARRLTWSERRKKRSYPSWWLPPVVPHSGRYEPNTNRERPPEGFDLPDEVFLAPHPRYVRLGRVTETKAPKTQSSRKKAGLYRG